MFPVISIGFQSLVNITQCHSAYHTHQTRDKSWKWVVVSGPLSITKACYPAGTQLEITLISSWFLVLILIYQFSTRNQSQFPNLKSESGCQPEIWVRLWLWNSVDIWLHFQPNSFSTRNQSQVVTLKECWYLVDFSTWPFLDQKSGQFFNLKSESGYDYEKPFFSFSVFQVMTVKLGWYLVFFCMTLFCDYEIRGKCVKTIA